MIVGVSKLSVGFQSKISNKKFDKWWYQCVNYKMLCDIN